MAEIAVSAASIFVSPLIGHVTKSVLATANGARKRDLEEEIRVFELKLVNIRDVVGDAESKQVGNVGVKGWLRELKDIMYDAEDALDEYATAVAIRRTLGGIWIRIKTKYSCKVAAKKILSINKRLETIVNGIQNLELIRLEESNRVNSKNLQWRQTTSLMDIGSHVFDREDAKRKIIELLTADTTESNNKPLLVLPIVGMGGIGKTTIAQLVFNDDSEVNKCFDLKIWICVSDDFDPEKLSRRIISSIYDKEETQEPPSLANSDLEGLHNALMKLIEGKKILLILDDVWNAESNMWGQLLKPLKLAKCGSRVVVTTRKEAVVEAIRNCLPPSCLQDPFFLYGLTKEGLWQITKTIGLANRDITSDYKELKEIGMEIVEKLKGSPLAARTIGRVLSCSPTVRHWNDILTSELWKLPQDEDDILPSLLLSYQQLDAGLKQCFSFCSLFPKDYCFDKEMMSCLWMAHNFLQVENGKSLIEIGEKVIDELLSWSFFHREMHNLKMHDLVHDLTQLTSQEDHLRLAGNIREEYPGTLRHVSLDASSNEKLWPSMLKVPSKYEKLRTLFVLQAIRSHFHISNMLGEWFERLRCLRVLVLAGCKFGELPKSISNLKHLRYLDLSHTDISKLPDSLTTLYNLQVLRLGGCLSLNTSPSGMRNLVNLRHLGVFYVGKKKGHDIEELENLGMLGGALSIKNLENVGSEEDAGKAKLHEKVCLRELTLEWRVDNNASMQNSEHAEAVLEALRPNSDLRCLRLEGYPGVKPPKWLSGKDSVNYIESIDLIYCNKLESLPSLGLLKHLKQLRLISITHLGRIGDEFYGNGEDVIFSSLEELTLWSLDRLEEWEGAEEGKRLFPRLKELVIRSCDRLQSLPDMRGLSSLQTLRLHNCYQLQSLPDMRGLSSLQTLFLEDCSQLKSLPDMRGLSSLQSLCLEDCSQLKSLPDMGGLSSLQTLCLEDCSQLKSLPDMGGLSSLQTLILKNCSQLKSLPDTGFPASLLKLDISRCPYLTQRYYSNRQGNPLFSHIPKVNIY